MQNKKDKTIDGGVGKESLTHEQRKELMGLMKRMLPPVPSRGIIDIRFSFWLFRHWYFVLIFGRDTRQEFRSDDKGDSSVWLTTIARIFTYIIMFLITLILLLYALYLVKSFLGIDIYPNAHLKDILREKLLGR